MTARFCCDGKCLDNQGRGTCPLDVRDLPSVEAEHPIILLVYALLIVGTPVACALLQ